MATSNSAQPRLATYFSNEKKILEWSTLGCDMDEQAEAPWTAIRKPIWSFFKAAVIGPGYTDLPPVPGLCTVVAKSL